MDYSILLPGIPASSARGALGWCTVSLIRSDSGLVLIDTGSYGDRSHLLQSLSDLEVKPEAVYTVFITHLHYDHFLNVDLFSNADIRVPARDLQYVMDGEFESAKDPYVPEIMVRSQLERLTSYEDGDSIAPGLTAVLLPGHTPGTSGLLLEEKKTLFAGDGIKNGYEYVKNEPPPCFFDPDVALSSYRKAEALAATIVPGHDCPFQSNGNRRIAYLDSASVSVTYQSGADLTEKQVPIS